MKGILAPGFALSLALLHGCAGPVEPVGDPVVWILDSIAQVGGYPAVMLGAPAVIQTRIGPAVEFDGVDDGLQVAVHPLAGAREFTIEAIFLPLAGGPAEQRFLHLQEEGSKDRMLLETRITNDGQWFFDTHIESGGKGHSLYAKHKPHPLGDWYHVALVLENGEMRHYVNGNLELARKIDYEPQAAGQTSIGVRLNRKSWFKGAIRRASFTPRALDPQQFTRN